LALVALEQAAQAMAIADLAAQPLVKLRLEAEKVLVIPVIPPPPADLVAVVDITQLLARVEQPDKVMLEEQVLVTLLDVGAVEAVLAAQAEMLVAVVHLVLRVMVGSALTGNLLEPTTLAVAAEVPLRGLRVAKLLEQAG